MKGLTISAIVCVFLLIGLIFVDFHFDGLSESTESKLEYFLETISLSYLAAYVFYFVNVHLVERQERKAIMPFVARNVLSIIVNNRSVLNCLKNNSKLPGDYFPDKADYKELLMNVDPKSSPPFYYKDKTWTYFLRIRQESTRELIERIFLSGKHVDDELRAILLDISTSLFLKEDYAFFSDDFDKPSLDGYQTVFANHFENIRLLKDFYAKHLKSYYLMSLPESLRS